MNLALVIIGALAVLVAYGVGYWQGKTAKSALDLNVSKAIPKVGTSVRIDKRQEESKAFPPFYYMIATIYNEGELAAKQLKGHCRLYSPTNDIQERSIPIEREFLGVSAPFELQAQRIYGTSVDASMRGEQDIRVNVDIEFDYLAPPEDKPQHYSAKYEYDKSSRQLVRV